MSKVKIEVLRMSVGDYARQFTVTKQTVYNRIRKGVLKTEQLAPHYPHSIIVRKRI